MAYEYRPRSKRGLSVGGPPHELQAVRSRQHLHAGGSQGRIKAETKTHYHKRRRRLNSAALPGHRGIKQVLRPAVTQYKPRTRIKNTEFKMSRIALYAQDLSPWENNALTYGLHRDRNGPPLPPPHA